MSGKERNWRFVQTSPSIDVHRISNILGRLANICQRRMNSLVLASWREQQATIGGECETSKEGGQCLVEVDRCIADTEGANAAHAGGVGHNSR